MKSVCVCAVLFSVGFVWEMTTQNIYYTHVSYTHTHTPIENNTKKIIQYAAYNSMKFKFGHIENIKSDEKEENKQTNNK